MASAPSIASSPHVYECGCGAVRHSDRPQLPVGWSTCRGLIWCDDCNAAGVPARVLNAKRGKTA